MDPVSLGIAAAALMATKFGEEFAVAAAAGSWGAIGRLREVIANKLSRDTEFGSAAAALEVVPTDEDRTLVAEVIAAAAGSDPVFADEVRRLVNSAREDEAIAAFVARSFDRSRQVNIVGDNVGTINLG